MKNRKYHILSILLIIFMIFLAISSEAPPPKEIKNSLSYETRGEYFFIKIRPHRNPKNYKTFDKESVTSFDLRYENIEEKQRFSYALGEFIIETIDNEYNITEKIVLDQPPFEIFIEGRNFIIKIKNEFLRYKNYNLDSVFFYVRHGGSIYEIYFK